MQPNLNFNDPATVREEAARLRDRRERSGRLLPDDALDKIASTLHTTDTHDAADCKRAMRLIRQTIRATGRK